MDQASNLAGVAPAESLDIEKNAAKPAPEASSCSTWKYIVGALVFVAIVGAVVAVVMTGASSSSSRSSTTTSTNYCASSSVGLSGVTAAQFTTAAQAAFKTTVATKLNAASTAIGITSFTDSVGRRTGTLTVAFRYYAIAPIPASAISTLTTFLSASNSTSDGFMQQFQTQLTSAAVTFPFTGTTGVSVAAQAPLMKLPTLSLMPTQSSGSRRAFNGVAPTVTNNAPAGTPVHTHSTDTETVIPGNGIMSVTKLPKDILCYVGLARVDDEGTWSGRTSPPTSGDSSGTYLAKYDPSLCDSGTPANTTNEYMSYQAWHTGAKGSNLQIHAYLWVYNEDPTAGAEPFVACKVTFTFDSNDHLTNTELVFTIGGDSLATTPVQSQARYRQNSTQNGCAKITADLATDNNGVSRYTAITSKVKIEGNSVEWDRPYLLEHRISEEAAVMAMSSTTAGISQTMSTQHRTATCDEAGATAAGDACSNYPDRVPRQGAAILSFDATRGAVLEANTTANLDISAGANYCLDRSDSDEYIESYSAFNAATGEKWVAPAPDTQSHSTGMWHYYNLSATDANGKAWAAPKHTRWAYNDASLQWEHMNPQPTSSVYCHETGEWCHPDGSEPTDITGDGNTDGYFSPNALPDFSGVSPSTESWQVADTNVILRIQRMKVVPKQLPNPASSCASLNIVAAATSPSSLTCGTQVPNRHSVYTAPTVPTVLTFVDGVRQL